MLKRTAIGALVTALIFSHLPQQIFAAEDNITKEVYVNVAQYKPVSSTVNDNNNYPRSNLVDGKDTIYEILSQGTVSIDLGRRYNIESIEIVKHYVPQGKIYLANKADFSDKIEAGAASSGNITLDGTNAYRYVIYDGPYATFYELKVFAKQTVTEVTRNRPVTASAFSEAYPPEKAVDGNNESASDCWLTPTTDVYHYLSIELEKPYNIGYVELEGRNAGSNDDVNARFDIGIYGTNNLTDDIKSAFTSTGIITDTNVARRLAFIGESWEYDQGGMKFPYPAYNPVAPDDSTYKVSVKEEAASKYIIYKKEKTNFAVALGQIRAYIVNPRLLSSSMDGKFINLSFSDEMKEESLEAIKIKSKKSNSELNFDVIKQDAYTYQLELEKEIFGDTLIVELTNEVKNMLDNPVVEKKLEFEASPALEIIAFDFIDNINADGNALLTIQNAQKAGARITIKNNMSEASDESSAVIIVALFDADNTMVTAAELRDTLVPSDTPETVYPGLDLSEYTNLTGYTLSVFIWNNFRVMNPWKNYQSLN